MKDLGKEYGVAPKNVIALTSRNRVHAAAQLKLDLMNPCVSQLVSGDTDVDLKTLRRKFGWRVCSGREEAQAEERG